jgi:hypothetical protein
MLCAPTVDSADGAVWFSLAWLSPTMIALEVWDAESWYVLADRHVRVARDAGAVVHLQFVLNVLAYSHLLAGELAAAVEEIEEARLITQATGTPRLPFAEMMLAAWRGHEAEASDLIEAALGQATPRGPDRMNTLAACARAVLYNGLGRYHAARDYARQAFLHDGVATGAFFVPEVLEAASRTSDLALVHAALEWLGERTRVTPSAGYSGLRRAPAPC